MKGNIFKMIEKEIDNKNNYHFVFALDGSDYLPMYEQMLWDLVDNKNVSFVIDDKNNTYLKTILLKRRVQAFTNGKLEFMGYEQNKLYHVVEKLYNEGEKPVIVFFNASLHYNNYLAYTLCKYKDKWKDIKFVLFYLDIIGAGVSRNADYLRERGIFDLVYSVDNRDCEKYNLIKYSTFYSANQKMQDITITNDLYFCGTSKDRSITLKKCADKANEFGVKCSMDVVSGFNKETTLDGISGINVLEPGKYLNYRTVLNKELQAKCILEICQCGQVALTLRPYEAVVYNRKLLSNNEAILDFEFFDERYMRYFEKIEDIDWEWVKRDIQVDYNYKGEFSPMSLLIDITSRFWKKSE